MSNGTYKLSVDDAIIDFLFKKAVVDQTEKLALSRISSKVEINIEEANLTLVDCAQRT